MHRPQRRSHRIALGGSVMQAAVVPAVSSSWQVKDVPQPQPGPNQVLVKMHRSEEHTSELQSRSDLVCRLLLEKKKKRNKNQQHSKQKAKQKRKFDISRERMQNAQEQDGSHGIGHIVQQPSSRHTRELSDATNR